MTGWVYVAAIDGMPGRLKIGKTNWHTPEDRIHDISRDTGTPGQMSLVYAALFDDPGGAEREAHLYLDDCRRKGEWFEISPEEAIETIRLIDGYEILEERLPEGWTEGDSKRETTQTADKDSPLSTTMLGQLRKVIAAAKARAEQGDAGAQVKFGDWLMWPDIEAPDGVMGELPIDTSTLRGKLDQVLGRGSQSHKASWEWLVLAAEKEGVKLYKSDSDDAWDHGFPEAKMWFERAALQKRLDATFQLLYWREELQISYRELIRWRCWAIDIYGSSPSANYEWESDISDIKEKLEALRVDMFSKHLPYNHPNLDDVPIKTEDDLFEQLEINDGFITPGSDLDVSFNALVGVKWSEIIGYAYICLHAELRSMEEAPLIRESMGRKLTRRTVRLAQHFLDQLWGFVTSRAFGNWSLPENSTFAKCARHFLLGEVVKDIQDIQDRYAPKVRHVGKVAWFNESKGYGFITQETGPDVFVHYREIETTGSKTLTDGQRVEFDLTTRDGGPAAERVTISD